MTRLPLTGLSVTLAGEGRELDDAAWFLSTLGIGRVEGSGADVVLADEGSEPTCDRPAGGVLRRGALTTELGGVPDGTFGYACSLALAGAALASLLADTRITVPTLDVAIQLFLPEVMAASYGAPHWPGPRQPVPAPGGGYLSCELGTAEDRESFTVLSGLLPSDTAAPAVAAAAQEWRLPVCDYRRRPTEPGRVGPVLLDKPGGDDRARRTEPAEAGRPGRPPLDGLTVIDLTSMWAGPLCTWLLSRLGATVRKVEPAVRVDGMRAFDGGGVHPGGHSSKPGRDSALFNALNTGKEGLDLDLRDDKARRELMTIVADADVVVDAFSPRVMPNLGLTPLELRSANPDIVTLSMPAFPPGPQRGWVAYGTGVHAVSGLGEINGSFVAPAVTYPDAIGGLTGTVAVLAGLVGRARGWPVTHLEVSLLSAVLPLLSTSRGAAAMCGHQPGQGAALLEAAITDAEALFPLDVGGQSLLHPVGPFRGAGIGTRPSAPPPPPGIRT